MGVSELGLLSCVSVITECQAYPIARNGRIKKDINADSNERGDLVLSVYGIGTNSRCLMFQRFPGKTGTPPWFPIVQSDRGDRQPAGRESLSHFQETVHIRYATGTSRDISRSAATGIPVLREIRLLCRLSYRRRRRYRVCEVPAFYCWRLCIPPACVSSRVPVVSHTFHATVHSAVAG